MVKVISTDPHKSVVKEVICKGCGATLQYTPVDVKRDYTTDYTGGREYYNHIDCPACGDKVHIKGGR